MRPVPILFLLLVLVAPVTASEFARGVRALRSDERDRRREALQDFARGRLRPASRSEVDRLDSALKRFLSDRHPGAERAWAVAALGRLDRPRSYERILDRLRKERDDRVLLAAEEAFRLAPPATLKGVLAHLAEARDPLERAVMVRMVGALPGEAARRRIRHHARVADHGVVRATAVHALARDRDPEVFPILIELLDSADPGLVAASVESLTRLTGLGHGNELDRWKAWWTAGGERQPLGTPLKPSDPAAKPDAHRYAHEREVDKLGSYFFGIPVRGRKVAFVFDVSASMRYKLDIAFDQLVRAVKGLPSTALFDVVFFNEHVWPWRGRLCHADPVTKELLVRHLPTLEIKSYTNLFDSLENALERRPDEIFVISDGAPNRGRKQLPRDILRELERINKKGAVIHAVSIVRVVDGDEHVGLLRSIAEAHGGTYVERTLK